MTRSVTSERPSAVVVLRSYRLSGRATPTGGRSARVSLQHWTGKVWAYERSVTSAADGSFSLPLVTHRAPLATRYRVRATFADDAVALGPSWTVQSLPRADVGVEMLTAADLPDTYRSGCPVAPASLRLLRVSHLGWYGYWARGAIVVARWAVTDVSGVLDAAAHAGFPIRTMAPVERYGGDDVRSMAADNTSAFNCRKVTGNPYRWSQHSWGDAVDVNTAENPYVTASRVYPAGSASYLDRSRYRKGMVMSTGPVQRSFAYRGWPWGARWSYPDYQHFSRNGG